MRRTYRSLVDRTPLNAPESHEPLDSAPGFNVRRLSTMIYAIGRTIWLYDDADLKLAAIMRPGFFNAHSHAIATRDTMHVIAADHTAWLRFVRMPISGLMTTWVR